MRVAGSHLLLWRVAAVASKRSSETPLVCVLCLLLARSSCGAQRALLCLFSTNRVLALFCLNMPWVHPLDWQPAVRAHLFVMSRGFKHPQSSFSSCCIHTPCPCALPPLLPHPPQCFISVSCGFVVSLSLSLSLSLSPSLSPHPSLPPPPSYSCSRSSSRLSGRLLSSPVTL